MLRDQVERGVCTYACVSKRRCHSRSNIGTSRSPRYEKSKERKSNIEKKKKKGKKEELGLSIDGCKWLFKCNIQSNLHGSAPGVSFNFGSAGNGASQFNQVDQLIRFSAFLPQWLCAMGRKPPPPWVSVCTLNCYRAALRYGRVLL